MGWIDTLLGRHKQNTASIAKERLHILIAQERTGCNAPDYLPVLRRELLEVIRKYIKVDFEAVKVGLVKDGTHDVLDISVALPDTPPLSPDTLR